MFPQDENVFRCVRVQFRDKTVYEANKRCSEQVQGVVQLYYVLSFV